MHHWPVTMYNSHFDMCSVWGYVLHIFRSQCYVRVFLLPDDDTEKECFFVIRVQNFHGSISNWLKQYYTCLFLVNALIQGVSELIKVAMFFNFVWRNFRKLSLADCSVKCITGLCAKWWISWHKTMTKWAQCVLKALGQIWTLIAQQ